MLVYTAIYNGLIIGQTTRLQDIFESEDYISARDYFENMITSSDAQIGYVCTYKIDDYQVECWRI